MSGHLARRYDVVVGWPDLYNSRTVYRRGNPAAIVGHIRSTTDPVRYFAETASHAPIEGTYKTRGEALEVLLTYVLERP